MVMSKCVRKGLIGSWAFRGRRDSGNLTGKSNESGVASPMNPLSQKSCSSTDIPVKCSILGLGMVAFVPVWFWINVNRNGHRHTV